MNLKIVLEPSDEGGYTAIVPALPGCVSEGNTADETLQNIQEAIEGYLLTLVAHGRKLPMEFPTIRTVPVSLKRRTARARAKAYA